LMFCAAGDVATPGGCRSSREKQNDERLSSWPEVLNRC
jgi:hypothetical protein